MGGPVGEEREGGLGRGCAQTVPVQAVVYCGVAMQLEGLAWGMQNRDGTVSGRVQLVCMWAIQLISFSL